MSDPIAKTEAYLDAIAAENPRLNAFVRVTDDLARHQAASVADEAALRGWCVAVKDNIDVAGVMTSNGLPGGVVPEADAPVIARLKAAGAIILGKTNLHEAALGSTTDNAHWGWTHNPLRHGYTAGGSSGGSAAAMAAGLCDAALGSDTMGSVRVPAGHCGLVGFKPTFDAIPCEGVAPLCWALDHVGPITKTVADARAMFVALADPVEPVSALEKPRLVKLSAFEALPLESAVAAAYAESLRRIEALYGPIETVDLPGFDPIALRRAALLVIEADAAAIHADRFADFSPGLRRMLEYGAKLSAPRLALALEQVRQARKAIVGLLRQVDAIVSPTTAMTAFPLDGQHPPGHSDFMGLAVFAGAPAISVPMPMAAGELPAGLQLIAASGRDLALLDWAEAIHLIVRASYSEKLTAIAIQFDRKML